MAKRFSGVAVWLLFSLAQQTQAGCDRRGEIASEPDASRKEPRTITSAGSMERALLDGLRVGERIEGYEVVWIRGIREDGGMEIRLEGGGKRMRLVVALDAPEPRPPVRTSKYALFYEGSRELHAANEEECLRVLEALAKRIRKVEDSVETPPGMRSLRPVATTM